MLLSKIYTRKILIYFKIMSKSEDITLFSKITWDPSSQNVQTFELQKPYIIYQDHLFFRMHIEYSFVFYF